MVPIHAFFQRRTAEATAEESVARRRINSWSRGYQTQMRNTSCKVESPPSRADWAPDSSPSDKNEIVKAENRRLGYCSYFWCLLRRHGKDEKCSSTSSRWAKLDESPSDSESQSYPINHRSQRASRMGETDAKCYVQWTTPFGTLWTNKTIDLPIYRLSVMNVSQNASLGVQTDYKYKWKRICSTNLIQYSQTTGPTGLVLRFD